ncbi:hypothetical protein DRN74_04495 [Candidatus Micrarchaeota archaeon]|nr:MAG: hypothetical protein DRN74_04495 [Candidatus Micrarchaeota archaeon]
MRRRKRGADKKLPLKIQETLPLEMKGSLRHRSPDPKASRSKKAVIFGNEAEREIVEKYNLKRVAFSSPDFFGEIGGVPVAVEVKHSTDGRLRLTQKQLDKIINTRIKNLEGKEVVPLLIVKAAGEEVIIDLRKVKRYIEENPSEMRHALWGPMKKKEEDIRRRLIKHKGYFGSKEEQKKAGKGRIIRCANLF